MTKPNRVRESERVEPEAATRWSDEQTGGYLPRLLAEVREAEQAAQEARARVMQASKRLKGLQP